MSLRDQAGRTTGSTSPPQDEPDRQGSQLGVAALLNVAPLAMAILAFTQAAGFQADMLNSGSETVDAMLMCLSLLLGAASVAWGKWQYLTVVQPLRQLAACGRSDAAASRHTAREIALLGRRLEPDITARDRDPLTGLLSGAVMRSGAQIVLENARPGDRLILLVVDIARLREINGVHGFGHGDELLRQFARRLTAIGGPPALGGRIGGDRFALLLPGSASMAQTIASALADAVARPFLIAGCETSVTTHIGAALFPDHAGGFERLLRAAELALEGARRGNSRWRMFDPQLNRAAAVRRDLERQLRRAVEEGQLVLHYQPQVELAAGRVLGVEALLRWNHPERGLVAPQTFIPVAEASGLIRPIGAWVLAEACRAALRWQEARLPVGISVNVSAAQLRHQDLPGTVAQALKATGLAPALLELELTESMFVDPSELAMHRAVQAIAGMGVRLAIDDFGTGYSSLGYLKRLPVDKIKIDKSFVRELGRDDGDAAIVRSIIGLAQTFGKRVLAEGIEDASQYRFLLAEGCHEGQGFYFARPMPENACTDFLRQHSLALPAGSAASAGVPQLLAS